MTDTPVVVIGGYLGSGKTTFINRILGSTHDRITVLVNDFGAVNIDASLIRNMSGDTIELTNGCVCCSVGDDLVDAMYRIADSQVRPDLVVIETSGVADPRIASSYAHIPGLRPGAVMVTVDATQVERQLANRLVSSTVAGQIAAADLLVVTKSTGAIDNAAVRRIRDVNGAAPIVDATEFDPALLTGTRPALSAGTPRHGSPHAARLEHPVIHDVDGAVAWLGSLEAAVMRAKGVVPTAQGNLLVERVGLNCSAVPTDAPPTDGVVVITVGGGASPGA